MKDSGKRISSATASTEPFRLPVPPTITSLYNDPALFKNYPFHADILTALENASVRPKTPVYQVVSIDISHLISPPSGISPAGTVNSLVGQLNNALQSKGLVP